MRLSPDCFYYCEPKNEFNMDNVNTFVSEIKAVSFKMCKTKTSNGFWQIFCFDKKNKPCGVILTKSKKIRLYVHREITK